MEVIKNKRIEWVDVLKGFAIILVLLTHSGFPGVFAIELSPFMVQIFFLLSGYVFSIKKYQTFKSFIYAKFKSLIIPLISFSCIIYVFNFTFKCLILNSIGIDEIVKQIIGTILQIRGSSDYRTPLWFISCLVSSEILMYFIIKISEDDNKKILLTILLSSVIGYLSLKFIKIDIPWSIDLAFTMTTFLGIGYLIKKNKDYFEKFIQVKYLFIFIILNLIFTFLNFKYLGTNVNLYGNQIGNYILYYISAISGIFMCIIFFRLIKTIKCLIYIGQNSLIYYCLHMIIFNILEVITKLFISNEIRNNFIIQIMISISYLLITCYIIKYLSLMINKYTPWMLGKLKKKEKHIF